MLTSRLHLRAAVVVAAGFAWASIDGTHAQVKPQPIAGYTVTLAEVLTTRDGVGRLISLQTQALRADGATVLRLGPKGATGRSIRLPAGLLIETNDRDKRMSTFSVSPENVAGYIRNPQEQCRHEGDEFRGEELIDTYRAAKITRQNGGSTRWYALDHSCALVRSVTEHSDGQKSETHVVALIPGPPDDALFQTHEFIEGPPSANKERASCDAACEAYWTRRDAEYARLRPK
jgi:hypothetical protein